MLNFESDYLEGAHEKILRRLIETNMEKLPGYCTDKYCESAKVKIRELCRCPEADIYFLAGGTQTNRTVIDASLRPYEGVIAAPTGHISTHEAGAIEDTGHKVLEIESNDGKIEAVSLIKYLKDFHDDVNHEHMVYPGMVYISHPTEYGTLYSKDELRRLSSVCAEYSIPLYLDGARLGYGLMSEGTDVALPDIAEYCDVFYIGGTKVGALCGEAVVFTKENTPRHFYTIIKQNGALMAKGRLVGIQFDALFSDGLYFAISRNAIEMANILKNILREKGFRFYNDSPTNQIFIVLENEKMKRLQADIGFSFWEKAGEDHTVVRLATSWATSIDDIRALADLLR
ncbi:MAG: beta-eliminating lyase-related protein [Eubacteriales bacterium]|nr:beta-eliminating lyase-related protein [Eubacteriales bacterium]